MKIGDLVSWNTTGEGFLHLIDPLSSIHEDYVDNPELKITGIVMKYYGEDPDNPDDDGHVKVLWNDSAQTITSTSLLTVINKGQENF